jgi:hypothetical protein
MSKISSYSLADDPLQLSDRLIGTEAPRPTPSATPLATKNFSLGELLQLFSSNFPAASLQAVLNTGNTAIQDINLTGSIYTTLIKPFDIEDVLGSTGNTFQVLSKATTGINWIDLPTNNLQVVLDTGNTATQNLNLLGNLSATRMVPGNIQDDVSSIGLTGQVLSKSATGVKWINSPSSFTAGLNDVLLVGNTATNDINLTGNIFSTLITPVNIKDKNLNIGTDGQVLIKKTVGFEWQDIPFPPLSGYVTYTGATQNVDLGEYQIKAGQLELDQTPTQTFNVGCMRWNNTDGTAEIKLKGGNVVLQVGQESVLRVVNKTATNINLLESNYQAVRLTGAQGQRLKVDLALATTDNLSAETIGLVTENINNNQEGFITTSGLVRNINTTGSLQGETWADGDILYLSPFTAGSVTKIKPTAPNHLVIVGYVVHAHANNGTIFVKVDNGYELDELHNVKIDTPLNNQGLVYNSTLQLWENKTIIQDAIVDGVTAVAPSQNAVFDALTLKQNNLGYTPANLAGDNFTGNIEAPSISLNGVNLESLMIAYAVALG